MSRSEQEAMALERAAELGEVGQYGTNRSLDLDDLLDAIESDVGIDLGTDTTSPLCQAIAKAYRAAYREANL